MRVLFWIVLVPVAIAIIAFALSNRAAVTVDFWPLDLVVVSPAFAVVLASLFAGFILGGLAATVSCGRARWRARAERRRAELAEREVARLQIAVQDLEDDAAGRKTALVPPVSTDAA